MDASDHRARIDRRLFAAAAAAWTGAAAGWLQGTPGSAAPPNSQAKPGPRALWPQHTASSPYIHAADFGLKPCLPDKMKIETFAENPDATEALQEALDAGAAGRVYIPPGAYRVTRPLIVHTGTTILGSGYQNYQAGITLTNCRGVQVHSCSATGSAHAILARHCAQLTIQGAQVNFDGSPWRRFGIRLEDCEHATLVGSVVEGMVRYGIALAGCRHFTAAGNVVRNTTDGPGLLIEKCEAGAVSANSVSQSAEDGMRISGCRHLGITGNVIDSYGRSKERQGAWRGLGIDNCQGCQDLGNIVLPG